MTSGIYRFDCFTLMPDDRRLCRDDRPVELNARYLDALALLVGEAGKLVSKDRFLAEVWRGVPVTDEALTQCIKTLRRQLGDDAARPRFIETVPKHGYRFIASVELEGEESAPRPAPTPALSSLRSIVLLGGAGTLGGAVAGMIGGLIYGFAAAAPGVGALSVMLVLLWLTVVMALIGGAGVSFGIAVAGAVAGRSSPWVIVGGAAGGLAIGALVKLLGLDAFNLLLGRSPGDITGAPEGLLLGAAVGLGAWLAGRTGASLRRTMAIASLAGIAAGFVITMLGGTLMAGSLDLLARTFPDSNLRLDAIGQALGETGFGPLSNVVTGALEGGLFAACVVGGMALARKRIRKS